jgi:hypothetical protein
LSSIHFFREQVDGRTGLVRDRARRNGDRSEGKASVSACGFALCAYVIAVERGWLERELAEAQVLQVRDCSILSVSHSRKRIHFRFFSHSLSWSRKRHAIMDFTITSWKWTAARGRGSAKCPPSTPASFWPVCG